VERCNEERPMLQGCKPPKCVGKFKDEFKVYDVRCRVVVKVCSKCGFEYEPHLHHMCPRCRYCGPGGYGYGGYGPGSYRPGGYGPGIFGPGGFQPGGMVYKGINDLPDDDDDD
jgi:hypothetical protein